MFEARDGGIVHRVDVEELDGGGAAHHGVIAFVNDSHRAGAQFGLQFVLPQLLSMDGCLLSFALHAIHDQREHKDRYRSEHEQAIQSPEHARENRERTISFCQIDFRGDADFKLGEPCPSSNHWDSSVVGITSDVAAAFARGRRCSHFGHRQFRSSLRRSKTSRHVAARISQQEMQYRARVRLVSEQAGKNEVVIKATVANHQALAIKSISFA